MNPHSEWQPIETAPENTKILTWSSYADHVYAVDAFHWRTSHLQEIESESHNAKGRRQIIQWTETREREWLQDGWGAEYWMPLPDPPKVSADVAVTAA